MCCLKGLSTVRFAAKYIAEEQALIGLPRFGRAWLDSERIEEGLRSTALFVFSEVTLN